MTQCRSVLNLLGATKSLHTSYSDSSISESFPLQFVSTKLVTFLTMLSLCGKEK